MYNITAHDVIPAYQVIQYTEDLLSVTSINDKSIWKLEFWLVAPGGVKQKVDAIPCDEYIEKYLDDLHPNQMDSITDEMYNNP